MRCYVKLLGFLAVLALLIPAGVNAQAKPESKGKVEKSGGNARLRIEVTAGEKKKPVENASVYVKYEQKRALGKDKMIEMNLKTNREGVARSPEIPAGKILVQVIAEGWKTFGRWYDIEEGQHTIQIHLEKPPRWY